MAVMMFGGHVVSGVHAQSDEGSYLYFAQNLTHGKYAVASSQLDGYYLWRGPGLPLVVATLLKIHGSIQVVRSIGPTSLALAGAIFAVILGRWVSPRIAVLGGLILAFYPPLLRLLPSLYSEPFSVLLVVAGFYFLLRAHEQSSLSWSALAGMMFGWLVLTRVEFGWLMLLALIVAAAVWTIRRTNTNLIYLTCIATAALVCVPWLVYTETLTSRALYWGSSGGESLYFMAITRGVGSWDSTVDVMRLSQWLPLRPLYESIAPLPQVQRSSILQHDAVVLIQHHPFNYAKHVIENASRMIVGGPNSFQAMGASRWIGYGLPNVALLAIASLAFLPKLRVRLPRFAKGVVLFGLASFLLHLPVAATERQLSMSVPAVILVVTFVIDALMCRCIASDA